MGWLDNSLLYTNTFNPDIFKWADDWVNTNRNYYERYTGKSKSMKRNSRKNKKR